MKVSFLVTYYNQESYVKQSIDSILAIEKPFDWELLVGDDGSDDGTTEVVKKYMELYPDNIFLYVMDREPGKQYEIVRRSSANRLNLINHMTGEFYCCLDGDDCYCHTGFVTQALEVFARHPETSVVAFGYQMFSDAAGVLCKQYLPEGFIETGDYLAKGMYTHSGACVYRNYMTSERKHYLNKIAYYDDNNIVTNNLYFGKLFAVPEIVYSYRQIDSSTYNSMQFAERAVLNAQSYDVDLQILPSQEPALLHRYRVSLLQTWFLSGALKKMLGADKWQRYTESCKKIPGSLTYGMLDWANAPAQHRKLTQNAAHRLIKAYPKLAVKEFLRCWRRRVY